jgi:hypothetical protein
VNAIIKNNGSLSKKKLPTVFIVINQNHESLNNLNYSNSKTDIKSISTEHIKITITYAM